MTGVVRTTLALVLLLAAVGAAFGGLGAQWLDQAARTPGPMREIVAPLSTDDRVGEAIAGELNTAATQEMPPLIGRLPGVRSQVETLIGEAVESALSDEGVTQAWHVSIDRSRAEFVAGLDRMRTEGADAPTLWLHLEPFVELGEARLVDLTPRPLQPYVAQLELPEDVRLALGRPATVQARYAADALAVAGHWEWFYVAAAALALVGLLVGSRRGRWVAWILAVGAGLVGLALGRGLVADVAAPSGDTVAAVVGARLVEGTASSLMAWTQPAATVGWALLALGVLGLLVAAARRGRATAPPAN
ncbi:hypothetical protein [Tessaracoccus sp. Z1128]